MSNKKIFLTTVLSSAFVLAAVLCAQHVFAAGTVFVTNGSTQIGTFPSTLPNNSFRITTSSLNSASISSISQNFVGSASATLSDTTGWTVSQNGSVDDGYKQITLGFNTSFNTTSYSSVYIGSNTYITFGSGSGNYSGLSASNPAIPGVHMCAADNSYQKVLYKLDNASTMRVRYEGNNSTSGTVGSPSIVYEAVFYSGQSYFDLHMGSNSRCGGDTTAPTISSVSSDKANGSYKVGEVIDIDVTFSEAVTSTGSVTVTLETGVTDRTCTFTVSNATTGTCNYTVQAGDTSADLTVNTISGTIKDAALNTMTNFTPSTNLAANKALVIDTTAPTVSSVTSSLANGSYKSGQVVPVQVVFSESVTVATASPQLVIVTGSPATTTLTYASGSGSTTLVFNYTVAGTNYSSDLDYGSTTALSLNSATIRDTAGNNATLTLATPGASGSLGASKALVIDNTAPTVALTSTAPSLTNVAIPVTATFSESVTGFVVGDISVTNGTAGSFSGSGTTYTFTVTPTGQGAVSISVASGVAQDAAANTNTASNTLSKTYDSVAPSVAITTLEASPTLATPIAYTATFSEAVTGFTLSDVTATNASVGNFQAVSSTVYMFDVSPVGHPTLNVDVTVSISASRAQDAAGNNNTASDSGTPAYIRFDNHSPTVAVTSLVGNPTNSATLSVTVTFSEAVTGFVEGDLSLTNATSSNFTGSGTTYTFDLVPSAQGTVSVSVPPASGQDAATNLSLVSNAFSTVYDSVAPTVVITTSASTPTNATPLSYTATFSEAVTGFVEGDLSLTNATSSNFAGSGTTYTFDLTPSAQGAVTVNVPSTSAQDSAGNTNSVSNSLSVTYDSVGPVLVEVTPVTDPTSDATPDYTFSSDEAGTITYGGDCSSSTTSAVSGSNTITFASLSDGLHNNCSIQVTDSLGTASVLVVSAFTILNSTPPEITNVSSDTVDGAYGVGQAVDIDITFSKSVTSTGSVTVTLETGSTDRSCTFTVTSSATASCNYIVQAGDTSSDLDLVSIAGTIDDTGGVPMTNFIPVTGLAANKAIVIDTAAPTTPGTPTTTSPTNNSTPSWTWTAAVDSGAGLAATPYSLEWSEDSGFASSVRTATSTTNSYTHGTSLSDSTWYFRVSALDAVGNTSAASANGSVVIDTVAPTVASLSPLDNATAVSSTTNLAISFHEPVVVGTGMISIYKTSGNSLVEDIDVAGGQVTGSGTSTITIDPANTLSSSTAYYIQIASTAIDDLAGNSYAGITNATSWDIVSADIDAPAISSITAVVASDTSARVSWTTDEASSSIVQYGLSASYGTATVEADTSPRVTSHSVSLSGLTSCKTYYFKVLSTDANGNQSESSGGTFVLPGCAGVVPLWIIQAAQDSQNTRTPEPVQVATSSGAASTTVSSGMPTEIPSNFRFTRDMKERNQIDDVVSLQIFLKEQGTAIYPEAAVTGYFGPKTKKAVIRFQEKYADEILAPVGNRRGTGFVGEYTRRKINALLSE